MNDVSFRKKSVTKEVVLCRIFVNIESKHFLLNDKLKPDDECI